MAPIMRSWSPHMSGLLVKSQKMGLQRFFTDIGRSPARLLELKLRNVMSWSSPKFGGTLPLRRLEPKSINFILLLRIDEGIVPMREWNKRILGKTKDMRKDRGSFD